MKKFEKEKDHEDGKNYIKWVNEFQIAIITNDIKYMKMEEKKLTFIYLQIIK